MANDNQNNIVEFTSDDAGIQWQNTTMIDSGSNYNNAVIVQKGYVLKQPLAVEVTNKNDQVSILTYGSVSNSCLDGDTPNNNTWYLTISTGYKKLNIKAGQTEYKTYDLNLTLQNAKIIEPQIIRDSHGDPQCYLDPKHTTIKLQANEGYTFANDGTLTYQRNNEQTVSTITIPASNTNTVNFNLPADFDWSNLKKYQPFILTMGATKAQIVESAGAFTNIYKADYTNLLKFSDEVIIKGSSGGFQEYDVTKYIKNLIMLPFDVPTGEKSSIIVGNETFTTQLPTVDNNYLTVNLFPRVRCYKIHQKFNYVTV